jgi:hypothetical protein
LPRAAPGTPSPRRGIKAAPERDRPLAHPGGSRCRTGRAVRGSAARDVTAPVVSNLDHEIAQAFGERPPVQRAGPRWSTTPAVFGAGWFTSSSVALLIAAHARDAWPGMSTWRTPRWLTASMIAFGTMGAVASSARDRRGRPGDGRRARNLGRSAATQRRTSLWDSSRQGSFTARPGTYL